MESDPTKIKINQYCEKCGCKMVIKQNKSTGMYFLGCTGYPNCKVTRPLPEDIKMRLAGAERML